MIRFLKSQNSRVDAFIDTDTGKLYFAAKGGEILRDTVAKAEDDAKAGRLTLDEAALPDAEIHTPNKSAAPPIRRVRAGG